LSSETSAFILRTPGKFPKEHRLHSENGESLKTIKMCYFAILLQQDSVWLFIVTRAIGWNKYCTVYTN